MIHFTDWIVTLTELACSQSAKPFTTASCALKASLRFFRQLALLFQQVALAELGAARDGVAVLARLGRLLFGALEDGAGAPARARMLPVAHRMQRDRENRARREGADRDAFL